MIKLAAARGHLIPGWAWNSPVVFSCDLCRLRAVEKPEEVSPNCRGAALCAQGLLKGQRCILPSKKETFPLNTAHRLSGSKAPHQSRGRECPQHSTASILLLAMPGLLRQRSTPAAASSCPPAPTLPPPSYQQPALGENQVSTRTERLQPGAP